METFSAAAKMPTVQAVLANAMEQDWEMEHLDVKSAYLNAPLKETVYMKAPRGVLKSGEEAKVLRLLKGLYGLKQAGRGWYLEMSRVFMKDLGFNRSAVDHSDNGPIAWFLGFQIKRDRNTRTISINQHAYIDGLLEKF